MNTNNEITPEMRDAVNMTMEELQSELEEKATEVLEGASSTIHPKKNYKVVRPGEERVLTRATYKRIKHYDKQKLQRYLDLVYNSGMSAAFKAVIAGMDQILDRVPNMTPEMKKNILDTINIVCQ